MARLAVNIDHVATVREARGTKEPDPVLAAGIAELAGAEGIICHLREDRRHINDRDLQLLRQTVKTKLNMEMAGVEEMVEIALKTGPDLVTLVPEKREELTTEGGLDVMAQIEYYTGITKRIKEAGIKVSFFVDPDSRQIRAAHKCGADIVEIHTGSYSEAKSDSEANERFEIISAAVKCAVDLNLDISAGHGLNYLNIKRFKSLPQINEYSIGHSIIARSVLVGFEKAVREMIEIVRDF
ncbi:MAG TPA: pyridoxine 5'-phosphate synthase [Desulfobacteraceae bacterium]|nr:pyridoxine 5'-phosphate synthase [Desulfobacteraceae bacterium]